MENDDLKNKKRPEDGKESAAPRKPDLRKNKFDEHFFDLSEENRCFTEDLLKENERLRNKIIALESNLGDESKTALSKLEEANAKLSVVTAEYERLRKELLDIKAKLVVTEEKNREFASEYQMIQEQSSKFTSLYVATYQLHSTMYLREVVQRLSDVTLNFLGAEFFSIYIYDAKEKKFVLAGGEGHPFPLGRCVPFDDPLLAEIAQEDEAIFAAKLKTEDKNNPIIVGIPMKTDGIIAGVLLIHKLLIQKPAFTEDDLDFFEMISTHASIAITAAGLYERDRGSMDSLEAFFKTQN